VSSFVIDAPVGLLFVEVGPSALRRVDFLTRRQTFMGQKVEAEVPVFDLSESASPIEKQLAADVAGQIDEYFDGSRRDFDLPLEFDSGSVFQQRVWQAIAGIPYGETASYADIAMAAGAPNAYRAVGSACGLNPIALIVPCHRVIASGNRLGGYGGGLESKVWLLRHEGVECSGARKDSLVRSRAGVGI
jgi:methylated-DNA-[protein]-cysteine S-methyltransferase